MKRLLVLATVAGALAAPALAHGAPAPIARPNPVTYPIRLDYEGPLTGAGGATASLAPLGAGVIMAAVHDAASLQFAQADDLGGFMPATIGRGALTSGGRSTVMRTRP